MPLINLVIFCFSPARSLILHWASWRTEKADSILFIIPNHTPLTRIIHEEDKNPLFKGALDMQQAVHSIGKNE